MDLFTLKKTSSPDEFSHHLRAQGPMFWSPGEGFWVITDHELAQSVLKSSDFSADRSSFFMSNLSGCPFHKVANFFGVVKKMMVTSDGVEHSQRRKLASAGINDHVISGFEPQVKKAVSHLLARLENRKTVEFV